MTYEIPLVRLGLGGGSGLSSGGKKVEMEWIVRVGSLGSAGKGGVVIEVSLFTQPLVWLSRSRRVSSTLTSFFSFPSAP